MSKTTSTVFLIFWITLMILLFISPLLIDVVPDIVPKIFNGFTWLHVILIAITIIIIYVVIVYNRFVEYSNSIIQSIAGIDVQLKRRSDLIPNLIAIVQGYAKHEKGIFTQVAMERAKMLGAQTTDQKAIINNQLSESLKSVFAIAEQYPILMANEQFLQLQKELTNTENEIAASRRIYNENVALFNTLRESFPSIIIGKLFGFSKSQFTTLA